jgi:hypothetical protein
MVQTLAAILRLFNPKIGLDQLTLTLDAAGKNQLVS